MALRGVGVSESEKNLCWVVEVGEDEGIGEEDGRETGGGGREGDDGWGCLFSPVGSWESDKNRRLLLGGSGSPGKLMLGEEHEANG